MKLSKFFLAAALATSVNVAVAAPQAYTLGDEVVANIPTNSFQDYSFSLAGGDLLAQTLSFTSTVSLSLFKVGVAAPLTPSSIDSFFTYTSYQFDGLSVGDYVARLTNTGSSLAVAGFKATVTPVPEAGSLALVAAGLGVVGLVATRRRKV